MLADQIVEQRTRKDEERRRREEEERLDEERLEREQREIQRHWDREHGVGAAPAAGAKAETAVEYRP